MSEQINHENMTLPRETRTMRSDIPFRVGLTMLELQQSLAGAGVRNDKDECMTSNLSQNHKRYRKSDDPNEND